MPSGGVLDGSMSAFDISKSKPWYEMERNSSFDRGHMSYQERARRKMREPTQAPFRVASVGVPSTHPIRSSSNLLVCHKLDTLASTRPRTTVLINYLNVFSPRGMGNNDLYWKEWQTPPPRVAHSHRVIDWQYSHIVRPTYCAPLDDDELDAYTLRVDVVTNWLAAFVLWWSYLI